MSPPAPPAAAGGWRLEAGFQLFSPFGFQSRRCAARCRTHQRSAERRSALSPGQTELCSPASRRTLPLSAPPPRSLLPLFFSSIHRLVFRSRWRRDVGDGRAAKMNPGEIRFTRLTSGFDAASTLSLWLSSVIRRFLMLWLDRV